MRFEDAPVPPPSSPPPVPPSGAPVRWPYIKMAFYGAFGIGCLAMLTHMSTYGLSEALGYGLGVAVASFLILGSLAAVVELVRWMRHHEPWD